MLSNQSPAARWQDLALLILSPRESVTRRLAEYLLKVNSWLLGPGGTRTRGYEAVDNAQGFGHQCRGDHSSALLSVKIKTLK